MGDQEVRILPKRAADVRRTDRPQATGGDIQETAEHARKQSADENARIDHRVHIRGQDTLYC